MEQPTDEEINHIWYMRPVFFVSDIQRAIAFYVSKLGFEKKWHEAEGKGTVCQVDRGGCEIILCQDATRHDRSRVFLELSRDGEDVVAGCGSEGFPSTEYARAMCVFAECAEL